MMLMLILLISTDLFSTAVVDSSLMAKQASLMLQEFYQETLLTVLL